MGRKAEPTMKFAVQFRVSPSEVAVDTAYASQTQGKKVCQRFTLYITR